MKKPFRVLSIDGGGMRGLYTASYLENLCRRFNDNQLKDVGSAFDLIVGTSTGGILACGLAAKVPLDKISDLYKEHGSSIFPSKTPELGFDGIKDKVLSLWSLLRWEKSRDDWANRGQTSLRAALNNVFGDLTVKELWDDRKIALCVPTVNMSHHHPWVFKTPHLIGKTRDDDYKLVDVALATSAAPILLPLAITDVPHKDEYDVFVDGGLWANNPVMVGLVEALQIADEGQEIQVVSIGTCAPPSGRIVPRDDGNWGLLRWKVGIEIVEASLDAQSSGYNFIASQIAPNLNRPCSVIRLPSNVPSGEQAQHVGMDKSDSTACKVLTDLGRNDAEMVHGLITRSDRNLAPIGDIFTSMQEIS